ncbi:LysR family transcriptional regulator [Oceanisphaera pacifica]|uniref:LysR family transcriptional regulator n=1 Tax=Oceanisphaera pacifica TaxID=2818389 RepID=A0ABS3NKD6_9GAMM|nr:LysR family transcriptional regulator [Oceanisphaera pacifica]MBO1520755.1 LysR family transcriptional regulator [Oceanisphaera pacifica]
MDNIHQLPNRQQLRGADIHRLSVFKTVVESGGLSQAADFLNVDLSTISRQVKDLEIRVGIELCSRGPKGFALTEQGRIVYDVACLLSEALQTSEERLEGLREDLSGVLRIGVVNHILLSPKLRFPELIKEVKKKAPKLTIECKVIPPNEIMRQVEKRQLHLGILGTAEQPVDLEFTPIFNEKAGLYCAIGHPLYNDNRIIFEREALEGLPYVSRSHSTLTDIRAQSLGLAAETSSNDIDVILSLILSGLYLGFLPIHTVEATNNNHRLRRLPIAGSECKVPFYACTLKRVQQNKRTELFLHILNDAFKGN